MAVISRVSKSRQGSVTHNNKTNRKSRQQQQQQEAKNLNETQTRSANKKIHAFTLHNERKRTNWRKCLSVKMNAYG